MDAGAHERRVPVEQISTRVRQLRARGWVGLVEGVRVHPSVNIRESDFMFFFTLFKYLVDEEEGDGLHS